MDMPEKEPRYDLFWCPGFLLAILSLIVVLPLGRSVHLRPFRTVDPAWDLMCLAGRFFFFPFVTQVSQLAKSLESAGFILSIFILFQHFKHYYITQNNQSH